MNFNPMELMKNLQNMQSNMNEMQEKLKDVTVEGSAGGGMVKVTMNGKMDVTDVKISEEVVDPEDVGMLEDLMLAAFTNAMNNTRDKIREEMSSLTGGMNIPPNFMGQ
ncbi:MAG: YbaB/EbfC family nucleoid-associated protein [Spirochaetia bacterium]